MSGNGTLVNQSQFGMAVLSTGNPLNQRMRKSAFGDGVMEVRMSDIGTPVFFEGCFPENELVHTSPDAHVPIGSLKVGDKISYWDVEQKQAQYTAVTGVHRYTVNDIMCFNNTLRVSSSHPLMVVESDENAILMPKWKVAFDVKVSDCVVGADGKLVAVKTKSRHWHDAGTEVLNLSTECGVPFLVGNCVVRAENATDNIEWADSPITQKLWVDAPIAQNLLLDTPRLEVHNPTLSVVA